MNQKIFITTEDNIKLCGIWERSVKKADKAIILAHGITVTKDEDGMFVELAQLLSQHGFDVFRFDFRGHGESEGKQEDMTIAGELKDLDTAYHEVTSQQYSHVGILGASFGGGISLLYNALYPHRFTCIGLWNPVLNYDHVFLHPYLPWLKAYKNLMATHLEELGYAEIGSRKFRLGKKLFEEMKQQFPYKELEKVDIPVLIIHGEKDQHVPYEDSKNYFESIKSKKELITIPEGLHGLDESLETKEVALMSTLQFFKKNL